MCQFSVAPREEDELLNITTEHLFPSFLGLWQASVWNLHPKPLLKKKKKTPKFLIAAHFQQGSSTNCEIWDFPQWNLRSSVQTHPLLTPCPRPGAPWWPQDTPEDSAGDLLISNLVFLGIQIILWFNSELLNRPGSVPAPWKREFFHQDGPTARNVIFFWLLSHLSSTTHGSRSSWLIPFLACMDQSASRESPRGESYRRQQETKGGKEDCLWQSWFK